MREDLGGRVYDVVGELLARNGVDFERLLREALLNPSSIEHGAARDRGARPAGLQGVRARRSAIAQATKHVDMSWVRERDWRSEERRLMPEYVEQFFGRACEQVGVRLEQRADGLMADRARSAGAAPPIGSRR